MAASLQQPERFGANIWGGVFLVLQWIMMGIFIWQLPPQIPLFYSLPSGESQLTDRAWFALLPVLSLLVFLVNHLLIRLFATTLLVFRIQLSWLTSLVIFFGFIAMLHIVLIVL